MHFRGEPSGTSVGGVLLEARRPRSSSPRYTRFVIPLRAARERPPGGRDDRAASHLGRDALLRVHVYYRECAWNPAGGRDLATRGRKRLGEAPAEEADRVREMQGAEKR